MNTLSLLPVLHLRSPRAWMCLLLFTVLSHSVITLRAQDCPTPGNLTVVDAGNTTVELAWQTVPEARAYRIYYRQSGSTDLARSVATLSPFGVLNGLQSGATYEVSVTAVCLSGESERSLATRVSTRDTDCNLRLALRTVDEACQRCANGRIEANVSGGRSPYRYSINQGQTFQTSSAFGNLAPGTYTVEVEDGWGCTARAQTTVAAWGCTAPTNVRTLNVEATSVQLTWQGSAQSYEVRVTEVRRSTRTYRSTDNLFTLSDLKPDTEYEVVVVANCNGETASSAPIRLTTQGGATCPAPAAPRLLPSGEANLSILWDRVEGARAYELSWRFPNETNTWRTASLTGNIYILRDLEPGTRIEVRLRSVCEGSISAYTPIVRTSTGGGQGCQAPDRPTVSNVGTDQARLQWTGVQGATAWEVDYRQQDRFDWTTVRTSTPSTRLEGLQAGTGYDVRVRTVCGTEVSEDSPLTRFQTLGTSNCPTPPRPATTTVNSTTVQLFWTEDPAVLIYEVSYRVRGTDTWERLETSFGSITLFALQPDADYEVRLRNKCTLTELSDYSVSSFFSTGSGGNGGGDGGGDGPGPDNCYAPGTPFESDITPNTALVSWRRGFEQERYEVRYRPANSNAAWITLFTTQTQVQLMGLTPLTPYEAQVRSDCGTIQSEWTESCNFTTRSTAFCRAPGLIRANNETSDGITLSWSWLPDINQYEAFYRPVGTQDWQSQSARTRNNIILQGLISGTDYEARVRSRCGDDYSYFSTSVLFTTLGAEGCATPAPPTVASVRSESAVVNLPAAGTFNIQYRTAGTGDYTLVTSEGPQARLTGLRAGSYYEVRIRRVCPQGNSAPSFSRYFNTPLGRTAGIGGRLTPRFRVYPNPSTGQFAVAVDAAESASLTLEILDRTGRVVWTRHREVETGHHQLEVDGSHWPAGLYLVRLAQDGIISTRKIQLD